MKRVLRCSKCQGRGVFTVTSLYGCPWCRGTGSPALGWAVKQRAVIGNRLQWWAIRKVVHYIFPQTPIERLAYSTLIRLANLGKRWKDV